MLTKDILAYLRTAVQATAEYEAQLQSYRDEENGFMEPSSKDMEKAWKELENVLPFSSELSDMLKKD